MLNFNKTDYMNNGYFVAEEILSVVEIEKLCQETVLICRGEKGAVKGLRTSEKGESDEAVLRQVLAIHFPHKISPLFTDFLSHPTIVDMLTQIIGPNVKCMQSILFIKPPGKPGQAWHQDEIPIPTRDRSLTGVWVALDDATVENGCMWVFPGSHRPGILYERIPHNNPRYDLTPQATRFPYTEDQAIPIEMSKGSILFFNGYLLHRSLNNRTHSKLRRTLVIHYMSAESFLPWGNHTDNRDIVMVAGEDPYEYKGIANYHHPSVRHSS